MTDQAKKSQSAADPLDAIIDALRTDNPNIRLFQINIPDRPDDIFIARKASWAEYKRLIGKVKDEASANEVVVQKFLVHPKPDYELIANEWDPGLVVTLAMQIQRGLGFSDGASVKNL